MTDPRPDVGRGYLPHLGDDDERREHHRRWLRANPTHHARRILEDVEHDQVSTSQQIALAQAWAQIAMAHEQHLANLIAMLEHAIDGHFTDNPIRDKRILAAIIRRESHVLPMPRVHVDGKHPNHHGPILPFAGVDRVADDDEGGEPDVGN